MTINQPRYTFTPMPLKGHKPTPLERAMAAFEGFLVMHVGSQEAEEAWRLAHAMLAEETERCCAAVIANVSGGAQRDRAIRAMKRGPK